ncbi:MAG: hypothetical protein ACRDT6_27595 [Micromonosporaceae bacterium]
MSNVGEVSAAVGAVVNAISTAVTAAQGARAEGQNLTQSAAAHGWAGVAATVQAACTSLEATLSSLVSANDAATGAASGLGEISSGMSHKEVAEKLTAAIGRLDAVGAAVGGAMGNAGQAYSCAQQSEADRLIAMIASVIAGLNGVKAAGEAAKTKAEAERQEAVSWGN